MTYSRYMIGTPEEKVMAFLSTHGNKPLVFGTTYVNSFSHTEVDEHGKVEPKCDIDNIKGMVEFVLYNAQYRDTKLLRGGRLQCSRGAARSVTDVWRCIIFYNKDIDIFSVMRAIRAMNVSNSYCSTVNRRVFEYGSYNFHNTYNLDEFGLLWKDWATIGRSHE
jgi:hypothetical protein